MSNRTNFIHMANRITNNGKDKVKQKEEVMLQALLWSADDDTDTINMIKAKRWTTEFWRDTK